MIPRQERKVRKEGRHWLPCASIDTKYAVELRNYRFLSLPSTELPTYLL